MKTKVKAKALEILLVEDNPGDIDFTREAIGNSKKLCNLNLVNKGKEAIAFLTKKGKFTKAPKIDMVLMSIRLPDMSGMDVLHEIRKNKNLKALPVVILTSSQLTSDALRNYNQDVFNFVTKPLQVECFDNLVLALTLPRSSN